MQHRALAPGKPGIAPTWCSSRKDLVITGLGSSHTWATLGFGILNEVYWPSTGRPQIRDLGFIVSDGDQWWELKRLRQYEISTPRPYVLLPTIRHKGEGFAVTLDVVCDDLRDVVLVRYKLAGEGFRLFALLAPRLGSRGRGNTAWCDGGAFYATGGATALALRASREFCRQSVGYVGRSDGWQDFHQNGKMTWSYDRAEDGNVAAMGELDGSEGVLALGFGRATRGADTLTRSSLADGYESVRDRVTRRWEEWGDNCTPPAELEKGTREQVEHSTAVLKTCEDRMFPGAVVASLSVPWGNSRDDLGGYHLVWSRDSVESALGMIAVGHFSEARRLIAYLMATQQHDGHWNRNFFPDGTPYGQGVQLDQTSFPVLLAAKLMELGQLGGLHGVDQMVHRALGFLLRAGPVTPQDRWEENEGISPFTLSLIIAAAVGAAPLVADDQERDYLLSYADYLNCRIEDWVYVQNSPLVRKYDVDGHYIRLATPQIFGGEHGDLPIAYGNGPVSAESVVALDYMYLARVGLRRADDPKLQDTLKVIEGELREETPNGPSYHRYNGDAYGEHEDGAPFDGSGKGRLWPLLTGERGHLAVLLGEDADEYLGAICRMSGPAGLIPEQVWDAKSIPEIDLYPGKPTGSAMPLLWAHAELVKLAAATVTKRPVELVNAVVNRYGGQRPSPKTWHWRAYAPFDALPAGVDLLVEATEPFQLHFGFNDWQEVQDRPSTRVGFGMHGVRLPADELESWNEINLTLHFEQGDEWEHTDHHIRLAPSGRPTAQRKRAQAAAH